jgi:hypothetical protein
VNINGAAVTCDGVAFEAAATASGFSENGWELTYLSGSLNPTPSNASCETVIRSFSWSGDLSVNLTVANGGYEVYVWVMEDNSAETFDVSLEDLLVVDNHNSGTQGTWSRLGPFATSVTDGALSLRCWGGACNVCGIEVWVP